MVKKIYMKTIDNSLVVGSVPFFKPIKNIKKS